MLQVLQIATAMNRIAGWIGVVRSRGKFVGVRKSPPFSRYQQESGVEFEDSIQALFVGSLFNNRLLESGDCVSARF